MTSARLLNRAARLGPVARALSRMHAVAYRRTGGRFLPRWAGRMPVLSITTVGRRSGHPRTTAIVYMEDGDRLVVVPSNAGSRSTPAWWLNLQADPDAEVEIKGRRRAVRARELDGEERERLWRRLVEQYAGFEEYERFSDRRQPVVVLEPR